MLQAVLIAMLAGLLGQVSDAKEIKPVYLDERIGEFDDLHSRYVVVKSNEGQAPVEDEPKEIIVDVMAYPPIYPKPSDVQRKHSVRVKGILMTYLMDFKRILFVPFLWAWDILWLPINFAKTGKYWWENRQNKKAELAQA